MRNHESEIRRCPVPGQESMNRVVLCYGRNIEGIEAWTVELFDNKNGRRCVRVCSNEGEARNEFQMQLRLAREARPALGPKDEDQLGW